LIDANNVVTKVTGKFGGNGIEGEDRIDFTAIKLSDNSFLAQVATGGLYKKGVFFEIEKNKISGDKTWDKTLISIKMGG
jgi:hypothetical protein